MEALIYQGFFLNYFLDNNTNFQLSSETKKKEEKKIQQLKQASINLFKRVNRHCVYLHFDSLF